MKKLVTMLVFVGATLVADAQTKVRVTDTLYMEIKTQPNQFKLRDEVDLLFDLGWRLTSADRTDENGKEIYTWKFYKTISYRKLKND